MEWKDSKYLQLLPLFMQHLSPCSNNLMFQKELFVGRVNYNFDSSLSEKKVNQMQ